MRYRITYVLVAILAVSAFLMPAAAAAQPSSNAASGLSSLAEIERYLTSIGVDFAGAVVQQGTQNYSGPNCPGSGWSCTTASVVIQRGVLNVADVSQCTDGDVDEDEDGVTCTIVQLPSPDGGKNMARCFIDTRDVSATGQTCTITQENTTGDNVVEVHLMISQKGGETQTGTQMATIMQTNDSGDNRSSVHETIDQDSSDGDSQSQDAHQTADVTQTSDTGRNFSVVHQSQKQTLDSNEPNVTQNQNANPTCGTPNISATVFQRSTHATDGGANESQLHQSIHQDENAHKATDGSQTQGEPCGGIFGNVTQRSSGVSRSVNHESEKQTQKANNGGDVNQTQFGPIFCCTSQRGNDANRFEINQSSDQSSNVMDADTIQQTDLNGTYHTDGDGMVRQRATNNTDKQSNQCSGPDCTATIVCGPPSSEFEGGCTATVSTGGD